VVFGSNNRSSTPLLATSLCSVPLWGMTTNSPSLRCTSRSFGLIVSLRFSLMVLTYKSLSSAIIFGFQNSLNRLNFWPKFTIWILAIVIASMFWKYFIINQCEISAHQLIFFISRGSGSPDPDIHPLLVNRLLLSLDSHLPVPVVLCQRASVGRRWCTRSLGWRARRLPALECCSGRARPFSAASSSSTSP
jgi:hypothetical protein